MCWVRVCQVVAIKRKGRLICLVDCDGDRIGIAVVVGGCEDRGGDDALAIAALLNGQGAADNRAVVIRLGEADGAVAKAVQAREGNGGLGWRSVGDGDAVLVVGASNEANWFALLIVMVSSTSLAAV